jgi:hypothetical protein
MLMEGIEGVCIEDIELDIEVIGVIYDLEKLVVTVKIPQRIGKVTFDFPIGFRVLDEADLLEYWPKFSLSNGWLYKIFKGGWKDLESKRQGFIKELHTQDLEYLIVGGNDCVSVLSRNEPVFLWENNS